MRRTVKIVIALTLVLVVAIWGCVDEAPHTTGRPMNITVRTLDAKKTYTKLASLRGHVVLIDFWGTYCGPCKITMPVLQKIYARYQSKGVKMMAITREDRDKINAFRKDSGVTYPMFTDETGVAMSAFRVEGIPHLFVVDKKGVVVYDEEAAPLTEDKLVLAIEKALQE